MNISRNTLQSALTFWDDEEGMCLILDEAERGVFLGGDANETDPKLFEAVKNCMAGASVVPVLERLVELGPDSLSVRYLKEAKEFGL